KVAGGGKAMSAPKSTSWRIKGTSTGGGVRNKLQVAAAKPTANAAATAGHNHRVVESGAACSVDVSGALSIQAIASPISRSLRLGSFSRHRRNTGNTLAGTPPQSGSRSMTAASVSVTVSPANKDLPFSIS